MKCFFLFSSVRTFFVRLIRAIRFDDVLYASDSLQLLVLSLARAFHSRVQFHLNIIFKFRYNAASSSHVLQFSIEHHERKKRATNEVEYIQSTSNLFSAVSEEN